MAGQLVLPSSGPELCIRVAWGHSGSIGMEGGWTAITVLACQCAIVKFGWGVVRKYISMFLELVSDPTFHQFLMGNDLWKHMLRSWPWKVSFKHGSDEVYLNFKVLNVLLQVQQDASACRTCILMSLRRQQCLSIITTIAIFIQTTQRGILLRLHALLGGPSSRLLARHMGHKGLCVPRKLNTEPSPQCPQRHKWLSHHLQWYVPSLQT